LLTIIDSNTTTAIAGVVLLIYGTGAIKGFALTLDGRYFDQYVHVRSS
jgi:preprotein translocase subunit SecD